MLSLTAAVLLLSLVGSLKCPDQQHCGDEQTCCQIQSGEFNCCPFQQVSEKKCFVQLVKHFLRASLWNL